MNPSIALTGMEFSPSRSEARALPAKKSQLRQVQKLAALGTLSAGIAHDFNNILAMLRGYLSMARANLDPHHPVQADLGEVENAALRAVGLAKRILSFSRPQEQELRPMRIEAAARDSLALLRATLPGRIEIVSEFAPDLPAVFGDPVQIQQVLVNLAINAAQAMSEHGGVIRVSIKQVRVDADSVPGLQGLRQGDYVWLRFSDTGCGMDAATRERIFEPFFTTKPRGVGTGLGLSVVREIIAEHRGLITVQSKLGKGTEFGLYFPAAGMEVAESDRAMHSPPGRGQRILFLDDDGGFVELARRVIGKAGYRVTGHTSAAEAVADFSSSPAAYDLVVADLSMPGASGIDVAERLVAIRADIPVILTAGFISPDDESRARTSGVREIIYKSATVEELCVAFGRVFGTCN